MSRRREESTPEQLDQVIIVGTGDPCRWANVREVWDPGDVDLSRWRERVPPHAVIHGLRRDGDRLRDLLRAERAETRRLRDELAAIRGAVRTLHDAVDLAALFDLDEEAPA